MLQSESLELTQDIINLRDFDTVEELLDKDLVAPQKLKQAAILSFSPLFHFVSVMWLHFLMFSLFCHRH